MKSLLLLLTFIGTFNIAFGQKTIYTKKESISLNHYCYVYGRDLNTPCYSDIISPIGWSKDGLFAYFHHIPTKSESTFLVILDVKTGEKILDALFYGESEQVAIEDKKAVEALKKHKIINQVEEATYDFGYLVAVNNELGKRNPQTDWPRQCESATAYIFDKKKKEHTPYRQSILVHKDKENEYSGELHYERVMKSPFGEYYTLFFYHISCGWEGDDHEFMLKVAGFDPSKNKELKP
ncbi:MAG: hypothetical protein MK212_05695 [Saprospiraceae bacterium]|nr:hypothetical protein [Saprospiraceae bacterium]